MTDTRPPVLTNRKHRALVRPPSGVKAASSKRLMRYKTKTPAGRRGAMIWAQR